MVAVFLFKKQRMCAQNKWGKMVTIVVQDDSVLPQ